MENLIAMLKNHKRDTAAALATLAAMGHALGALWEITAPWFPKALTTAEIAAGVLGGAGFGHAWMKSRGPKSDVLPVED